MLLEIDAFHSFHSKICSLAQADKDVTLCYHWILIGFSCRLLRRVL